MPSLIKGKSITPISKSAILASSTRSAFLDFKNLLTISRVAGDAMNSMPSVSALIRVLVSLSDTHGKHELCRNTDLRQNEAGGLSTSGPANKLVQLSLPRKSESPAFWPTELCPSVRHVLRRADLLHPVRKRAHQSRYNRQPSSKEARSVAE
jgi:hypothetical protein